ncbi:hypothetical protein AB0A95_30570 [Micromonospora sp. NPDC049230]|uniref:hypothetical protein n=1 Tax=Micromonospora sp. NPDC049230 TaxID=3155502 RepID=UPI00340074AE
MNSDPNQAPVIDSALDVLRDETAPVERTIEAARALLDAIQIRVGVDDEHPDRIAVTLHGLDIYVDRQGSDRVVEFGRDEMPGLLSVDTSLADLVE